MYVSHQLVDFSAIQADSMEM